MTNATGNKEYKSDVFSMLLQDKRRALEVYNAINGTDYDDSEEVEITTLEDRSFSLTVRNDASFILDANLSLYEHQSTVCPNMPLRDLFYFASIIQKRIHVQKRDLYGKKLVKIPVPHFVVFYNGTADAKERYELCLSDAFEHRTDKPELELVCQVYNINKGNNSELLSKCPTLREYMYFVDAVRDHNEETGDLEEAIRRAIEQCIKENVLKEFLSKRGKEVLHMMTLDYTFEKRLELQREEAAEEGRIEGEKLGIIKGEKIGRIEGEKLGRIEGEKYGKNLGMQEKLREQVCKKLLKNKSLEQIADELEESPESILPIYEKIKKELNSSNTEK